jgi:hypothetical protein
MGAMSSIINILTILLMLVTTPAFAQQSMTMTPAQAEFEQRIADVELAKARDLCFSYSVPNGQLLGCLPNQRMCNRTFKWPDECLAVEQRWVKSGAEARAEIARQVQEMEDHTLIQRMGR